MARAVCGAILHGHRHPRLDQALREQLDRVAHVTNLGMSNPTTIELAKRLVELTPPGLNHVFFSDDGATAVEVALKMAFQYWRQRPDPRPEKTVYVALGDAYHGDTLGSVSVGGVERFHAMFEPLLFKTIRVPAPDMYRLPPGVGQDSALSHYLDQVEQVFAAETSANRRDGDRTVRAMCRRNDRASAGIFARRARTLQQIRSAADRRRSGRRLRADRPNVCLRARASFARLALFGQRHYRWISAAGRHTGHGRNLAGVSGNVCRFEDLFPRPHLRWKSAGRGGGTWRICKCSKRNERSNKFSRRLLGWQNTWRGFQSIITSAMCGSAVSSPASNSFKINRQSCRILGRSAAVGEFASRRWPRAYSFGHSATSSSLCRRWRFGSMNSIEFAPPWNTVLKKRRPIDRPLPAAACRPLTVPTISSHDPTRQSTPRWAVAGRRWRSPCGAILL